jgi:hypothetical protein
MPRSGYTIPAAVAVLAGLTSACVAHTSVHGLPAATTGGVAPGAGLTIGDRVLPVTGCRSGDHSHFLGADLVGASGEPLLRVLIDPLEGPRLRLLGRSGRAVLGPDQCPELRASVHDTGWRVNEIRDVAGEVQARCTLEDGAMLEAHIVFDHCH